MSENTTAIRERLDDLEMSAAMLEATETHGILYDLIREVRALLAEVDRLHAEVSGVRVTLNARTEGLV